MMEAKPDFTIQPSERVRTMHPQKFAMWLFMISVTMLFVAFTSAYLVKKGAGNWEFIPMPSMFLYSSIIIALSSLSMHWAYISAKRDSLFQIRFATAVTGILAVGFVSTQIIAADELVERGVHLVGNPAGSFIYILGLVHTAHLIGGMVFLTIVLVSAFKSQVHSKRLARIEICTTYWHFLGGLWLYLYIFLIYNN